MKSPEHRMPGFRLSRLEVRNWGTFHNSIHILNPEGKTALLIGENGSGKSTLVDALLTLLVPKTKRNYNLSAGGARKRERDERTYVLGAYGSQSESEESRAQTKFLRKPGDPPSILLAVFANAVTSEVVTLAQVLWIQEDDPRRLYLISRTERSIATDFGGLQDSKTWKKAFRKKGFEVDDVFNEYAEKAVRYLKMESLTTLALFSQTVAIKEISHVSAFIRDHMLERIDSKELVDRLDRHYEDLNDCYKAIQKAKKQLHLLSPIVEKAEILARCDSEVDVARQLRSMLPGWFAARLKALYSKEVLLGKEKSALLDNEIANLDLKIDGLAQQEFALKQAIDNDEIGKELTRVSLDLAATETLEIERRALAVKYHFCLGALGMKEEITSEVRFGEVYAWAESEHKNQADLITKSAEEKAEAELEFSRLRRLFEALETELHSLRARLDLIPESQRQIRSIIADGAGVQVTALPFAGELMDVRPEYKGWRGALERLLRGFGLSLLVPEHLYSRVNRFINEHDFRGRVVYHRVPRDIGTSAPSHDKGRVIERIQVKADHPLSGWIESELRTHFNYRCCDTIEEFESSSGFAITKQGLRRSGGTRHVKDDTFNINDARTHILGWSNREKIKSLEQEQSDYARSAQQQATLIGATKEKQATAVERSTKASKLLSFRTFAEIDWHSASARKEELKRRKEELEASSDKIRKLKEDLDRTTAEKKASEGHRTSRVGDRGALKARISSYEERFSECESALAGVSLDDLVKHDTAVLSLLSGVEPTIENAPIAQHTADSSVSNQLIELGDKRGKIIEGITKAQGSFLAEFPELKTEYSGGEDFLKEFLKLEADVRRDDLPRYDQKFQDLMSRDVLVHVVKFQDTLSDHCEEIRNKIAHLNAALKGIDYSPKTFISIRATYTSDHDIRDFRARLERCLKFGLNADGAAREDAFKQISDLIELIRQKPEWSAKVTDTRNWLSFVVEERDRETGNQENIYEDTSGKSGGQKAKLAFTILASALAYQYGIARDRENAESFRFVVVDEIFSRSDETNSRYALSLFAQFHLQLLIVSPFDARARVVEPFVSSYHLTLNPTTKASTVKTVTVEEVQEQLSRQSESLSDANT